MISSRKQANVEKALGLLKADNLDVAGVTCHVGKAEDREKLLGETLTQFGGVDFLISNAAVNPTYGSILDVSRTIFDQCDQFILQTYHEFMSTKGHRRSMVQDLWRERKIQFSVGQTSCARDE